MAFLKRLADGLNHAEFDLPPYHPTYFDQWVKSLTLYHNLAFIQKGANQEPSNILPPHPRPARVYAIRRSARLRPTLARWVGRRR